MHNELIEILWYCGQGKGCKECPLWDKPSKACFEASNDAADALEAADKRIAELEAHSQKWTMLKDEMPKPHTNVLVSGIEAINNSRVYKVMVNDNGTLRPTDYAPSIRWDYWMPFESPNCGARMRGEHDEQADC